MAVHWRRNVLHPWAEPAPAREAARASPTEVMAGRVWTVEKRGVDQARGGRCGDTGPAHVTPPHFLLTCWSNGSKCQRGTGTFFHLLMEENDTLREEV